MGRAETTDGSRVGGCVLWHSCCVWARGSTQVASIPLGRRAHQLNTSQLCASLHTPTPCGRVTGWRLGVGRPADDRKRLGMDGDDILPMAGLCDGLPVQRAVGTLVWSQQGGEGRLFCYARSRPPWNVPLLLPPNRQVGARGRLPYVCAPKRSSHGQPGRVHSGLRIR